MGDESRYWGNNKDGVGLYFKVINRNKKSVTADLRTPLGVEIVKRLVQDGRHPGRELQTGNAGAVGIGWDTLSGDQPEADHVAHHRVRADRAQRRRPGFGTLAEAYSGFAYINGFPDQPPILPAFGLADSTAGSWARFWPWSR